MPKKPSLKHIAKGHSHHEGGVAVLAEKAPLNVRPSKHTVSLHGKVSVPVAPVVAVRKPVMPPRGFIGRLRHLLDERIHLHDLRMRTLSIRPRGWKDFPPTNATTMHQAVSMTGSRFFNEHPLADLTVLSVLHLGVLAIMHLAQVPGRKVSEGAAPYVEMLPEMPEMPSFERRVKPAVESPSFLGAFGESGSDVLGSCQGVTPQMRLRPEGPQAALRGPHPLPPARTEIASVAVAVGADVQIAAPISQPTPNLAPALSVAPPNLVPKMAPLAKVPSLPLRSKIAVWLSPTARAMRPRPVAPILLKTVKVKAQTVEHAPTEMILEKVKIPKQKAAPQKREPVLARPSVFTQGWQRGVLGFAGVAMLLVLPFGVYGSLGNINDVKDRVIGESLGAISLLKMAGSSAKDRDFAGASRAFAQADESFGDVTRQLGILSTMLNAAPKLLPGTAISAASPLLNAGREIAQGGERLASGMAAAEGADDPTAKLATLRSYLTEALPHLERANSQLSGVNIDAIPAKYRGQVSEAQRDLPKLTNAVRKASAVADVMGVLLGEREPKRYLVIFQNNAEIRPTGGFMGSFAMVDVHQGKVVKMDIPGGGTYDLKGSLTARISSPQPLHLVNALWQFQDANWYPDFPTSAKQITWFYDKSGGPTTDGVIAINASLMEQLLEVTGPIEMPEYGKTISSQNFYVETQKAVEVEYDKAENKPKQFIADLAPKVIDKLMHADSSKLVALAATMDEALAKRDVQLWLKDTETQSRISDLGWGGEMKNTDGDFLYLVHTNIAGQKTDLQMRDDVQHSVKILPDGTGIVTLTLTRTHTGVKGTQFNGVRNVDYVRFYVPQGSALVEAHGFDAPDPKLFKMGDGTEGEDAAVAASEKNTKIDRDSGTRINDEGGKTVFGNWMQTDPGESSVVTLVYQLPADMITVTRAPEGRLAELYGKIAGNRRDRIDYSLLVQKQSGTGPMTFSSSIDLPRGFSPSWQAPQRRQDDRGRWTVSSAIDRDSFFGSVAEGQ